MAEQLRAPGIEEKMSLWLGLGVFFMPWLFCWATVRRKHTPLARIMAFGWAMFWMAFFAEGAVRRARAETRAVVAVAEHGGLGAAPCSDAK